MEPVAFSVGESADILGVPSWRVRRTADKLFGDSLDRLGGRDRLLTADHIEAIALDLARRGLMPAEADA